MVAAFGNQAYVEWTDRHAQGADAWQLLLRTLAWPRWYLTPGGNATRDVIAFNVRALLLVVLVAAMLALAGSTVLAGGGSFVLGWFAVIVASAVATLLTTVLTTNATLYNALLSVQAASAYGLFVGWLVGLLTAATRRPVVATA